MSATRKLHVVRPYHGDDDSSTFPKDMEPRPRVMIVTSNPDRFSDLPATVDFAPDHLEAIANGITVPYDFIIADITLSNSRESGCKLVRQLRAHHRLKMPIYLVSDEPLPSDRQYAQGHGATDLLLRDRRVLAAILRGEPVRASARSARAEPPWLGTVIAAMRQFIASEAEPRVRAIYASLQARLVDENVEWLDVVNETSLLLDDLDDRKALLRMAGVPRK